MLVLFGNMNAICLILTYISLVGGVKLSVYKGDITNELADVIVSPSEKHVTHSGGISKAIVDKGGKAIEDQSRNLVRKRGGCLKGGEAIWTRSGKLPCKFVVHVVGPDWGAQGLTKSQEILHRACLNSLYEADKLKATSIVLPAIGSGYLGMPKDVCAEVMCQTVREYIENRNTWKNTIADIRFVNNDAESLHAFSKKARTLFGYNLSGDSWRRGSTVSAPCRSGGDGYEADPAGYDHKTRDPRYSKASSSTIGGNHASQTVTQHPLGLGSSDDANNQSPSSSSRSSSHGTSYSNALRRNTSGNDASPLKIQEPGSPNERRDKRDEG